MVTSRLNHRCIWQTLGLIAFGVLSLCGFNKETFLPILFVWMGFTLLFSAFYLASIKRITVVVDGLETRNLLLPFWKRFYRFAEFDYAQSDYRKTGEVLRLIKNGERLLSIASNLYLNFEEIKCRSRIGIQQGTLVWDYRFRVILCAHWCCCCSFRCD